MEEEGLPSPMGKEELQPPKASLASSSDDFRKQRRRQEHAVQRRATSTLTQIRPRTEAEETLAEKRRRIEQSELTWKRPLRMDPASDDISWQVEQVFDTFSLDESEGPWIEGWIVTEDCVFQLSARALKVGELAAFAAALRKELQSFFDNSVSQFCDEIGKSER